MSLITIPFTFSAGAVIIASQHNSCNSVIYSDYNGNVTDANIATNAAIAFSKVNTAGQVLNADINAGAAIVDTKLAQITTASKVSGTAITGLSSLPSGAGVIPTANLGSGTANSGTILYGDQTYKTAPASISNNIFSANISNNTTTGNGTYVNWMLSKFKKIATINTLTWYAYISTNSGSNTARCKVDVGGINSNTASTSAAVWITNTLDVSSLTTGTIYDITITVTKDENNATAVIWGGTPSSANTGGGVIIFGS